MINDDSPEVDLTPPQPDPALADLNPKQLAFVLNFIDTGNASESARRAGYSASSVQVLASTGSRLLAEPLVRKAIAALRDATWTAAAAGRSERIAILSAIVRGGDPAAGCPPTYADRISAAKLLALMNGECGKMQVNVGHVSYCVPMPERIKDAEAWTKHANATMAELETPPSPPASGA